VKVDLAGGGEYTGTVGITFSNDLTFKDMSGNPSTDSFTTPDLYTVDRQKPRLLSIERYNGAPALTNQSTVQFRVVFSEPVLAVAANFPLNNSGSISGALVADAQAVNDSYIVTVSGINGFGGVGLSSQLYDPAVAAAVLPPRDLVGNTIPFSPSPLDLDVHEEYIIDSIAPSVINTFPPAAADPVAATTSVLVYSDEPMGLGSPSSFARFTVVETGTSTAVLGSWQYHSSHMSAVEFQPTSELLGNTTYRVTVPATATDAAGNELGAPFTLEFTTSVMDVSAPAITAFAASPPVNNGTVDVSMSVEDDTGVVRWYIAVDNATSPSVAMMGLGSSSQPTTFTYGGDDGPHTVYAWVMDAAQRISPAAHMVVERDTTQPSVVSIVPLGTNPTVTSDGVFRVTFSEPVTGVTMAQMELQLSHSATGTVGTVTPASGLHTEFNVTVSSMSGPGSVALLVGGTGGIVDEAGNVLAAGAASDPPFAVYPEGEFFPVVYDLSQETYSAEKLWDNMYGSLDDNNFGTKNYNTMSVWRANVTYFAFVDGDAYARIVRIPDNGSSVTTALVDDYKFLRDGHHSVSIGMDRDGYIHVSGDMHNYPIANTMHLPAEYRSGKCMYWRSDAPYSIDSFTWLGGGEDGAMPWGTSFSYVSFTNDRHGRLFYYARTRFSDNGNAHAFSVSRYDEGTRVWTAIAQSGVSRENAITLFGNVEAGTSTYTRIHGWVSFDRDACVCQRCRRLGNIAVQPASSLCVTQPVRVLGRRRRHVVPC